MAPDKYQIILIFIIAALWLGVGNLIIRDAIRKKGLSQMHQLNPLVLFKLDAIDWGKILLLTMAVAGLACLLALL